MVRRIQESDELFHSIPFSWNHVMIYNYEGEANYTVVNTIRNDDRLKLNDVIDYLIEKNRMLYGRDNRSNKRFDTNINRIKSKYGNDSWNMLEAAIRRGDVDDVDLSYLIKNSIYGENYKYGRTDSSEILGDINLLTDLPEDTTLQWIWPTSRNYSQTLKSLMSICVQDSGYISIWRVVQYSYRPSHLIGVPVVYSYYYFVV